MVIGESRYFTLSPVGGGSLVDYSAIYQIRDKAGAVIKSGNVTNTGSLFDVKIHTTGMKAGEYKIVVLMTAVDGFIQAYEESVVLR